MESNEKKKSNIVLIIILVILAIIIFGFVYITMYKRGNLKNGEINVKNNNIYLSYRLSSNSLEDFDLYFLQLENEKKNKIYSPLSIKYALEMLMEGADGESRNEIANIIGTYNAKKYLNSSNMSFANALFVKNTFKDSINESYVNSLKDKFNAEIIYDSFDSPNNLNSWISNKTFKLVNNMVDDISDNDFILANALAIDMEWVNKIRDLDKNFYVEYAHEDYSKYLFGLRYDDYHELDFSGFSKKAQSIEIGAVSNKYDIINTLGEENIRDNISKKYTEWLNSEEYESYSCDPGNDLDVKTYVDEYITDISKNYGNIGGSTDFNFYVSDNVKVFAKDLRKYDGITLQYIGIMPINDSLDSYINNVKASELNNLINNLKNIELDSFKDGVITDIYGYIPVFSFEYELNLKEDLSKLGINSVFDSNKADLSNLTSSPSFISDVSHKSNIEFSNDGIKAAAAVMEGGKGAGNCGFDYLYDVPVEKIDLTFDKPYMFIIRDKDSGEVWFTGTVYEPNEYKTIFNH